MTLEAQVKLLREALEKTREYFDSRSDIGRRIAAALAATAEPAQTECLEVPAPKGSHHAGHADCVHDGAEACTVMAPSPAPLDAPQCCRDSAANRAAYATAPRDAEREALLAFGEKVLEAERFAVAEYNATGRYEPPDLAALLPVRK